MARTDRERLAAEAARPRIVALWEHLQAMRSPVTFLQIGAHPDDETSEMLAALTFRDGLSLAYICATRGEGGQNAVGPETGPALGALRTREMERAAARLLMRLHWLCPAPGDPLHDFGFSKSGADTLARWGKGPTLARLVAAIRAVRPDILCPTFLDVPGQHGHHRAMTSLAPEAIAAAADPAYPAPGAPWQVAKLVLPAWSGAGTSYDDDLPPPPASFTIPGKGADPVTAWSYAHIGQQSRAFHASQGMGRWVPPEAERDWPLHLAEATVPGATLTAGLPTCLADLGDPSLAEADRALEEARAAFPDPAAIAQAMARAHALLRNAKAPPEAAHRLARKALQAAHILRLTGPLTSAHIDADLLAPGDTARLTGTPSLPEGWEARNGTLHITDKAAPTQGYPGPYDPLAPPLPALEITAHGATSRQPLDHAPAILPAARATPEPAALLLNTAAPLPLTTRLDAAATATLPEGWQAQTEGDRLTLTPPETLPKGLVEIPLAIGDTPAQAVTPIRAAHIAPTLLTSPATIRIRVLEAQIAPGKTGHLGAAGDRTGHWLAAMGADLHPLKDLQNLDDLQSLVLGPCLLGARPDLTHALPRLHAWIAQGGTLLTLYHRPWDNWGPKTAPKPIEIGQPSLRWRVTDPAAPVEPLAPDHPCLTTPNRIGPEDWDGWVKERGLYFAKSWDPAYTPLVALADPGETPHKGALLAADIGQGRHVHCALGLAHQMGHLVPGAFRLMANLIAPR